MFLLVPAYPGSPGQKAVKLVFVCVCVCVCVLHSCNDLIGQLLNRPVSLRSCKDADILALIV